jgi:hypothetical protein
MMAKVGCRNVWVGEEQWCCVEPLANVIEWVFDVRTLEI